MAADLVVPVVYGFRAELLDVETGQYYMRFDDVPEVGTEVITRCHPRPAVWTSCGIQIGDLPARHHEDIRKSVYCGKVVWNRSGVAPIVHVELLPAAN
jgi:hypothetical protein